MAEDAQGDHQNEFGTKVLVVFAHPQRESFCGAALEEVVAGIAESNGTSRVRDLYSEGFDPRLTASEFERERSEGHEIEVSPAIRREQHDVMWADAVVFVCPLWWSDVPAILKGWFDRVWTKDFAWKHNGETELRRAASKSALLLVSAGNPRDKLAADGVIQSLQAVTMGDRLQNVGFEPVELVVLDGLAESDEIAVRLMLEQARSAGRRVSVRRIS